MAINKILFDSQTRTFSAEGEDLTEATVTFAEKEEATNVWREVWGHLQTWMFGGGPIQNIVSAVDARELVDRCNREHWSPSKCVAEVKKAAHKQKKTTRIISTITGTVAAIGGSAHAGIAAAAAGAAGGAVVGVAAAALVVVLILCCLYGWTIGAWISKRGFIRIIESKLHKELMDDAA